MQPFLVSEPNHPVSPLNFVFAHGAGSFMDSDFMAFFAEQIAAQGIRVVRFEFPYCQQRRATGKMRPPNKLPVLIDAFAQVIERWGGAQCCVAGGKSLGGRVASVLAAEMPIRGVVSLGYPFHPPRKPERIRNQHWHQIEVPWLIVQGCRDPFGKSEEVVQYNLPPTSQLHWLAEGDHDFKPRLRSGLTQSDLWQQAVATVVTFIKSLEN